MSNAALSHVWKHSVQKGNALLVLLALADIADDSGKCYPGIPHIAKKTRMTQRNVQSILRKLESDGEVKTQINGGAKAKKGHTNLYVVAMERVNNGSSLEVQQMNGDSPHNEKGVNEASPLTPDGVNGGSPNTSVKEDTSVKDNTERKEKDKPDTEISHSASEIVSADTAVSYKPNSPEIQTAVKDTFKVNFGGYNGKIGAQLLGTADKGERKNCNITPPMTPVEIVAFGQWYREAYAGKSEKPPATAATLEERIMEFREDTKRYAKKMAIAEQRLTRLMQPGSDPDVSPAPPVAPAPIEREGTLKSGDMAPVQEWEVAGYVKAGLMTADEQPRPTMKIIYDRLAQRMGSNNNAARTD